MSMTKTNDEKFCDKTTESECLVPIQYYSLENTSKFCAEGSVAARSNSMVKSDLAAM